MWDGVGGSNEIVCSSVFCNNKEAHPGRSVAESPDFVEDRPGSIYRRVVGFFSTGYRHSVSFFSKLHFVPVFPLTE